jgi:prepilin-type N-terminal cleavage/methylation domain-containing protein
MNSSKSGFSLLEVLAAIVLTGLFMSIFAQVFAIARGSNGIPGELLAAVARSRIVLSEVGHSDFAETTSSQALFHERVEISEPNIVETPGTIPPPISSSVDRQPPAPTAQWRLRTVDVVITTPSGRRTELEGVSSTRPQK